MAQRAVVVLKPKGKNPVHLILPHKAKVLSIVKMSMAEITKAEDHGHTFYNFSLPEGKT